MKKITLALTFGVCQSLLFGQSQRLVFIEEYTQASCPPCAQANPGFNALLSANTTKAVSVKYQVSWPGTDPMYSQNTADVDNRVAYNNVTGVPDAFLDGVDKSNPGNITQSNINSEYAIPSPFTIKLNHWLNAANDSVYVNCEITCSQNVTMATPKVRIAMIEKAITFTSPPGSNGEKDFSNVMRKMYPSANGTAMATNWTVGQKKIISFKAKIPAYIYDKAQIAFAAWIQDDATQNVKQAGYSATSAAVTTPPVADFTVDVAAPCDGIVNFQDQSGLFPTSWSWDFGDGATSNLKNPAHKYIANGTYTVKMTATNANGSNLATKSSLITINNSGTAPTGVSAKRCGSGVVNLSASPSGSGTLNWYDASGALVHTGTTYSPTISGTSKFYVSEMTPNAVISGARADSALGAGSFFAAATAHGLYFDVAKPCSLVSVKVYANSAGNRTIEVLDVNGTKIQSAVVNLTTGANTVTLNFALPVGAGYFIHFASGSTVAAYRNIGNATYPYSNNLVSITGNDAGSTATGYYYFFYDWKLQANACASQSAVVIGSDSCSITGINDLSIKNTLAVYPNPGNGLFTTSFQANTIDNYNVKVTNTLGQTVYEETLNHFSGAYSKQMDISSFGKGVYMLVISNAKNEETKRVMVY